MKVRATQDGHYGGYYRYGPKEDAEGILQPGEVFEIDATPRPLKDESGKPVQEMTQTGELNEKGNPILKPVWVLGENGKPKKDAQGNLIPKIRMVTAFTADWMEPVNEDASVDFPDQIKPMGVLKEYLPKAVGKASVAARPVNLPADVAAVLNGTDHKSESVI